MVIPGKWKLALGAAVFMVGAGCDDTPGSVEVRVAVFDLSAARIATEAREDVAVDFAQQSTDKESEDYSKEEILTDADGEVVARVTENQLHTYAAVGLEDLQGATGYFRAGEEDLDLREMPLPITDRLFGEYVYCNDALNIQGTDSEGRGAAWLRIYKLAGDFEESDELVVRNIARGSAVRQGENLISDAVAGVRYIDIYDDALVDGDRVGHVDAAIYADDFDAEGSDYSVTLNGEEIEFELGPCSEGKSTVVYL